MRAPHFAAVAAVIALGCSALRPAARGSADTPRSEPVVGEKVRVKPLELVEAARPPDSAVILGTAKDDSSLRLEIPGTVGRVELALPWLGPDARASIGSAPAPAPEPTSSAAAKPADQGRTPTPPRATPAIAPTPISAHAVLATSSLGKSVSAIHISVVAPKSLPLGAEAGAALTVAIMATITGHDLADTTTVIGAVHPDGSLGVPEDVAALVTASLESGATTIGVPPGVGRPIDPTTMKAVNLAATARERGARLVEVADVTAAYRLMTNHRLPAALPAPASEMRLSPAASAGLTTAYERARTGLADHWPTVVEILADRRAPPRIIAFARVAAEQAKRAEVAAKHRSMVAAYAHIQRAEIYAFATHLAHDVVRAVRAGKLGAAKQRLGAGALGKDSIQTVERAVGEIRLAVVSDHLRYVSALSAARAAAASNELATSRLGRAKQALARTSKPSTPTKPGAFQKLASLVLDAGLAAGTARTLAREATDALAVQRETSLPFVLDAQATAEAASAFATSARHIVESNPALSDDPAWAAARLDGRSPGRDPTPRDSVGQLGLGLRAVLAAGTASAMAGLAPSRDDTGRLTSVAHPKALVALVKTTERRARQHARTARVAIGIIPVQARLSYLRGQALSTTGRLDDSWHAVHAFLESSMYALLAVELARSEATAGRATSRTREPGTRRPTRRTRPPAPRAR